MLYTIERKAIHRAGGFTLIELLVVVSVILILLGMFLPAVRTSGVAARRTACSNNLRQVGLALLNYESVYLHFPAAMGGYQDIADASQDGMQRVTGMARLLPYIEASNQWETICSVSTFDGMEFPPVPAPWQPNYPPWQDQIEGFLCPSSFDIDSQFAQTSYAFCIGDTARNIHQPATQRGAFACGRITELRAVADGTSNTIFLAEIGSPHDRRSIGNVAIDQSLAILNNPSLCKAVLDENNRYAAQVALAELERGGCWADGAAGSSLFNTILPPGSASCSVGSDHVADGIYSAGSSHSGGIQVTRGDGSATFISNSIDAGDGTISTPLDSTEGQAAASPYGVWGALGTIAGEEKTDASL